MKVLCCAVCLAATGCASSTVPASGGAAHVAAAGAGAAARLPLGAGEARSAQREHASQLAAHEPAPAPSAAPAARAAEAPKLALQCTIDHASARPAQESALFVLVGERAELRTYWIEVGPQGVYIVAASPEVIVSWRGGVWRSQFNRFIYKAPGCADAGMDGPAENEGGELVLERLDAKAPRKFIAAAPPPPSRVAGTAMTTIIGLIGNYLFLKREESAHHCGPHPIDTVALDVVPLEPQSLPKIQPAPALRADAKLRIASHHRELGLSFAGPPTIDHAGIIPVFEAGKARARHVFVADTVNAASTWGSYRHAVFIDAPMPAAITAGAVIPAWLAELDCREAIVGFSAAPLYSAATENVKQSFRSPAAD